MILIKLKEVIQITSLSKTTIYSMIDKGEFPKQIPIGQRAVAFDKSSIDAWVQSRIALRDNVGG